MSLTSFLKVEDVKAKFRQEFPTPKLDVEREIQAEPRTKNYALVGTAFDYLLRFYIKHLNPEAIAQPWIAELPFTSRVDSKGSEIWVSPPYSPDADWGHVQELIHKAETIIAEAKASYAAFLKTGQMNDDLIKYALLLAKMDVIFRRGLDIVEVMEGIEVINNDDVSDLKHLISLVEPGIFKANQVCLLDPTFGEASRLVGGADVDLVIDDTIIDIKTTKNFRLAPEYYHQLIGYYALYRLGGIDGLPAGNQICRLGIYFSRHGYLHVFGVQDVIDEIEFSRFLEWFKNRARMTGH